MESSTNSELPPGFRFHPTDEELIVYYLCNQATSKPCPASIIPEVDIYKFDPWELPDKSEFGENEWYFFSPRERKYPNGVRPNRATLSGYWKATGTDKAIHSGSNSKHIGVKKSLVFYKGKPPKGIKTNWIMHEYRLIGSQQQTSKHIGSMRLDDWVLCRIYKKKQMGKTLQQKEDYSTNQFNDSTITNSDEQERMNMNLPRTCSFTYLLDMNYFGPILSDGSNFDFQINNSNIGIDPLVKPQPVEMSNYYEADSGMYQVKQSSITNQPMFVKQMHDYLG